MHLGLLAGLGAIFTQALATAGIQMPWLAGTLTAWAVIAVLGTRRIDLTGRLLAVLLIAEVTVMIGYDAVLLTHPHGGHPQVGPLSPTQLLAPGGLIALIGVAASFTGIELPTVLGEEAKNPHHTTGRATRTAVLLTGTLYTISAWALPVATGTDQIQQAAREHGPLLLFTLISPHTPAPLVQAGQVLLLTSVFAAALAFHTTATRYLFALAREHVLPARLGATSRTGAPTPASLLHSLGTLLALTAYTATGAHDPLKHLLLWGTITGGFGITALMAATSFAATTYLTRTRTTGTGTGTGTGIRVNWWTRRLAPTTSGILLTTALILSLSQLPILFATTPSSPWTWALPGIYLTATAIALTRATHLRHTHPHALTRLGHGTQTPALTP